jgi:hypothetical protein
MKSFLNRKTLFLGVIFLVVIVLSFIIRKGPYEGFANPKATNTGKPVVSKPVVSKPATGKPATGKPATGKPATTTGKPMTGKTSRPTNKKLSSLEKHMGDLHKDIADIISG